MKVAGRLDAEQAPVFEKACQDLLEPEVRNMIVDLGELTYVSSMGLRSFIVIGKKLTERGGTLQLCSATGLVKQVFEITGLNSIFSMHSSLASALAAV